MVVKITHKTGKTAKLENTGQHQAKPKAGAKNSSQWQKGVSGNPKGKPKGATNHATRAMEKLLDGQGEAITLAGIFGVHNKPENYAVQFIAYAYWYNRKHCGARGPRWSRRAVCSPDRIG